MFAGLAMMVREGLWSNTLTLINIIISGLVAFGFYSPLVDLSRRRSDQRPAHLLARFRRHLGVCLRDDGHLPHTHRPRLRKRECDSSTRSIHVGGPLVGFIAAWVLAAFTLATLHTSPMPKDAFGDWLNHPRCRLRIAVISPRRGLAAIRREHVADRRPSVPQATEDFSAKAFVNIYGDHREEFEKAPS